MSKIRSNVLTALVTAALMAVLFAGVGNRTPTVVVPKVEAQATTTRADLITNYRTNVNQFLTWKDNTKALRAQFDALGFTWVNGDFTGSNAGITATQFTTYVTNASLVVAAWESGATLSSGFPATFYNVK